MVRYKPRRYHDPIKPRIRPTWNRVNLYNLSRLLEPRTPQKTFFQQKWSAKAITRGFHGEHIKESKWKHMFDKNLPAVVPMDHQYLARYDGSEQAAGRGSGLDSQNLGRLQRTPYMQMVYHPTERRLDTAIWRALFASSIRQARQFVVHGWVKVNGKRFRHPGYQLNPGDMFQVDPERVMMATGEKKMTPKEKAISMYWQNRRNGIEDGGMGAFYATEGNSGSESGNYEIQSSGAAADESTNAAEPSETAADSSSSEMTVAEAAQVDVEATGNTSLEGKAATAESRSIEHEGELDEEDAKIGDEADPRETLQKLLERAKAILNTRDLSNRSKKELRAFRTLLKKTIARPLSQTTDNDAATNKVDDLNSELATLELNIRAPTSTSSSPLGSEVPQSKYAAKVSRREALQLKEALALAYENQVDPSKPYATPWAPRPYMSAFAFIPRYLEVQQNICSAVYLRHPVARPGLAEVPTPFGEGLNQLAFNWYLRRR